MTVHQESRYDYYEKLYGKPDKVFSEQGFLQMVWIGDNDARRILINDLGIVHKALYKNEADSIKNKGLCYPAQYTQEHG